eukprot:COSAG04_NODE_3213_length_3044_cov_1.344992_5_plen_74_part_01
MVNPLNICGRFLFASTLMRPQWQSSQRWPMIVQLCLMDGLVSAWYSPASVLREEFASGFFWPRALRVPGLTLD